MATSFLDKYIDGVLAKAEGTTFHDKGQDKRPTLPYGIRVDIAKSFGAKRANESDRDYAKRIVEQKYLPEVKKKLGTTWDKIPESMKIVALDTHFNAGLNIAPSFVKNLKAGNYKEALKDTLDIVGVTDDKTKKEYTSPGLANRRAAAYNLAAKDLNQPTITDTLVSKEGVVSYFTGEGRDVLFSKDIGKPLYPTSSVNFRAPAEFSFQRDPVKSKAQQTKKGIISQANATETPVGAGAGRGFVNPLLALTNSEFGLEVPGDTVSAEWQGFMPDATVPTPPPSAGAGRGFVNPPFVASNQDEIRGDTVNPEWAAYMDALKAGRDDLFGGYPARITEPIQVIPNVMREYIPEVSIGAGAGRGLVNPPSVMPDEVYRDNEIRPKSFMGEPVAPQNIWRDSQGNPILDRFGGYIYQKQY